MTLLSAQRKVEKEADYERANAYHELKVQLISK
jgi:hypothetical protein